MLTSIRKYQKIKNYAKGNCFKIKIKLMEITGKAEELTNKT